MTRTWGKAWAILLRLTGFACLGLGSAFSMGPSRLAKVQFENRRASRRVHHGCLATRALDHRDMPSRLISKLTLVQAASSSGGEGFNSTLSSTFLRRMNDWVQTRGSSRDFVATRASSILATAVDYIQAFRSIQVHARFPRLP